MVSIFDGYRRIGTIGDTGRRGWREQVREGVVLGLDKIKDNNTYRTGATSEEDSARYEQTARLFRLVCNDPEAPQSHEERDASEYQASNIAEILSVRLKSPGNVDHVCI
jgi:hypothetical protein